MQQYEGIYDNQDRVRPDYYAFKFLSLIRGQNLHVTGTVDIHAFAARGGRWVNVVLWNFPKVGGGTPHEVTVRLNPEAPASYLDQSVPMESIGSRSLNSSYLLGHLLRHILSYQLDGNTYILDHMPVPT